MPKKLDIVWERLRNYGDQPFEFHVNNNYGDQPFEYHVNNNYGDQPFEYHVNNNYGEQPFEYHVNNTCYKPYTHIKSLKKLQYSFPSKSLKKLQVRKLYSFPSKYSNRVFCFQCYEKLHSTCWAAKARRRPTFL